MEETILSLFYLRGHPFVIKTKRKCNTLLLFNRSVMSDSVIPCKAARQCCISLTSSWSLFKLMSTDSVMPSNHLILCHHLLFLFSIFPSIRVFSNESVLCIRWSKDWSFSFSISSSSEYSGLISFRIDCFDLLAVGGTQRVFSSTTARKHQFFGTQPSLCSNFHICT